MLPQILNAYKTSFSGLSRESWLLSAVIFLNRCGYMAAPFMSLYVTQALNGSKMDAGIIGTLFGCGAILGAIVGGKLTDVFGFRPVQIFSSLSGGIFFLLFSQIKDFDTLCIFTFLVSFFSDAFRPANFTAIAAYAAPGKETRSYSLNRLATNTGFGIGISLGGIIASYDYQLLFIVDGITGILVALAILWFLPAVKGFRKKVAEKLGGATVRKPWRDYQFVKFLALNAVFATCFFLMFRVVPVFYKESWHLDEALIGVVLAINGFIIALFEMVMVAKIENKRSPQFYIALGVLIVALSFGVLLLPKFLPIIVAVVSVACFTFGEMFSIPFINTYVIKRSNEFNRGQYAAAYTVSWSTAQISAPTIGFLVAAQFNYSTLFAGITIMLIFCAYGFYSLDYKNEG